MRHPLPVAFVVFVASCMPAETPSASDDALAQEAAHRRSVQEEARRQRVAAQAQIEDAQAQGRARAAQMQRQAADDLRRAQQQAEDLRAQAAAANAARVSAAADAGPSEADQETAKRAKDPLVYDLCYWTAMRDDAERRLRAEQTNPSGVRDLRAMHDAGVDIQNADRALAPLRAQYLRERKKGFVVAACAGIYD